VLRRFSVTSPRVRVVVSETNNQDALESVASRITDVAYVRLPTTLRHGLMAQRVLQGPMIVALPQEYPLEDRDGRRRRTPRPVSDPAVAGQRTRSPRLPARLPRRSRLPPARPARGGSDGGGSGPGLERHRLQPGGAVGGGGVVPRRGVPLAPSLRFAAQFRRRLA
jgi:hypothetical protein